VYKSDANTVKLKRNVVKAFNSISLDKQLRFDLDPPVTAEHWAMKALQQCK